MIAIYKGWANTEKAYHVSEASISDSGLWKSPQQESFKFINSTTTKRAKGRSTQRIIRAHVRNKHVEKQRKAATRQVMEGDEDQKQPATTRRTHVPDGSLKQVYPKMVSQMFTDLPGTSTELCLFNYPIHMQPSTHRLLERYLSYASSRMYPKGLRLRFNPLRSRAWFHFAVTDAALFHALLYSGALYLALLEGKTESTEMLYHQNQMISIVVRRLSQSNEVKDSTIGAISCLALGEVRCLAVAPRYKLIV
jgi:hypothetical protein